MSGVLPVVNLQIAEDVGCAEEDVWNVSTARWCRATDADEGDAVARAENLQELGLRHGPAGRGEVEPICEIVRRDSKRLGLQARGGGRRLLCVIEELRRAPHNRLPLVLLFA